MSGQDNLTAILTAIDRVDGRLRELLQKLDELRGQADDALDAAVNLKWDALIYQLEQDDEVQP